MKIYDLSDALLKVSVDIRPEIVARELIELGLASIEDTLIVPEGAFKRSFSKEISTLTEEESPEAGRSRMVKVNVFREGLPDMLPPGIIYQPAITREERTAEVMLREAEIHDAEFQHARNFFLPLDIEFGRQRIYLEQFEHQSIADTYSHYSHDLYAYLWPDMKLELTPFQKAALLELTMNAHHVGGDLDDCSFYMEKILGYPVQINTENEAGWVKDEIENLTSLGDSVLGVDWIPFQSYQDFECIKIKIGSIPVEEMIHFRHHEPVGKNYQILEFLCDLLLPVEISWTMMLIPNEGHFQINKGRDTAVLGYSSILG